MDGYPLLTEPSLASPLSTTSSGGIFGDLTSAANQLGFGQAIDLLQGIVMPSITQAMQSATPAAATPAVTPIIPPATLPVEGATGLAAEASGGLAAEQAAVATGTTAG